MNHTLHIPDALLAWGKHPDQAKRWPRAWAHEIEAIVAKATVPCFECSGSGGADGGGSCSSCGGSACYQHPLEGPVARRFWECLEALVCHAVWEDHHDLLLELDTYSAHMLGLRFTFEGPPEAPGRFSAGWGTDWPMPALESLLEANLPQGEAIAVDRLRASVQEVFPDAVIGSVFGPDASVDGDTCAGCGAVEVAVMVESASGLSYCPPCWQFFIKPWPRIEWRGTRLVVHRDAV